MSQTPRIVLLTGPFAAHDAFVRYVASRLPVAAVIRETRSLPRTSFARRAAATVASQVASPGRLIATVRKWMSSKREYRRLLASSGPPPESLAEHRVHSLNDPSSIALLQSLQPDLIAVCGTGLLTAPVFSTAPRGSINIHLGLSPRYRGSHCVFWPLYKGEPEWVGVTIHYLTEGIDAGPVLLQARPSIEPDDTAESLVTKCLLLGNALVVEALQQLARGPVAGIPQRHADGRNYNARECTPEAVKELDRRIADGFLRDYLLEHGGRVPDVALLRAWPS